MRAPKLEIPQSMNAAACFVDANVEAGREGRTALIDGGDGSSLTYGEVLQRTNRFGRALESEGVRVEERVMLLLPDGPDLACGFWGAIKIGAVPIPVSTLLTSSDYRHLLQDSRAGVLVVSRSLLPAVEPILGDLPFLRRLLIAGADEGEAAALSATLPSCPVLALTAALEGASPELSPVMLSKDDPCFWLYTSGTTGLPKAAVHLQHDMLVCADLYFRGVLGLSEEDRCFSVAKLFFAYGLGNGLYGPFRVGASAVLYPGKPEPEAVFGIVERHRPTVFYSVPTGYAGLLAFDSAEECFDTSSLRLAVSAGEALPPSLYETFHQRFGVEILDGIGSTEVLHIFISNRPGEVKAGSSGRLVPGYEARLMDGDGREAAAGEIGDLWIKGDSTCAFYWNRHEGTKDVLEGHWIRTGDKYRRDDEGYFWYQGRSDDMLKVGGYWVSPAEVEAALLGHEAVLEAAVVGAADEQGLIKPRAHIALKPGREPSADLARELQAFVKGRLSPYKFPRQIEFVRALPKTATGKIQRFKLRS